MIAQVRLEIAGLMSTGTAKDIAGKKELLEDQARSHGVQMKSPITNLSFLSLPVIPELKLTDKGLFDVNKNRFIDPIVK
jgi:adenine deaminase